VIQPAIRFVTQADFSRNALGEVAQPVEHDFEYHSGRNSRFLNAEEIVAFNQLAGAT
jgi:hypothetical protein